MTQSAVSLSWSAASDNVGVAGYDMYLGAIVVGTTAQTNFAFSGLSCGTSYTVGVDAYDPVGNRSAVSWLIVTTAACADTSPPSAPTNLLEPAGTVSGISATWTASTDNVGVTGYRVLVDGSLAGTTAATSYTVTGLSCGSSHRVVVDAFDAAGNRSPQASATMATSACTTALPGDSQPPTTPTGLAVASAGQTTIALTWNASTDNVGIAGYGLYVDGSLAASPATTGYTVIGLICGTSHTVAVDAYDAAGNRSNVATITTSTAACPDTQPPASPTNVSLGARTTTSISINWTPSTDNVSVAGYDLYVGGSVVGVATTTAYTFTGLACGTSYNLAVDAYDAANNHSGQTVAMVNTAACPDVLAPSVPSGLSSSGIGQTAVTLSWAASSDNVGVTGYRLYRAGSQVGTSLTTSYLFSGLTCGTSYTLGVAAVDAAGNISSQTSVTAATSACPDVLAPSVPSGLSSSGIGQTAVTLSWAASSDNVGVTGYRLYRAGSQVGTSLTTSYLFSGLTCGTSYTLGVAAVDAAGNTSSQASVSATTSACSPPQAPGGPTCSPSPCTLGTNTAQTISVDDSSVAPGHKVTRTYYLDRPVNLVNDASHTAPLLVIFGSGPSDPDQDPIQVLAATNKFVTVTIPNVHSVSGTPPTCTSGSAGAQYALFTASQNYPTGACFSVCGPSGTALCDDIPWVKAVLDSVIASQHIDPNHIWVEGGSKGGTATMEVVCNTTTSNYFSAAMPVSLWNGSPIQVSPNGDQTAAPWCPAILGTANPASAGDGGRVDGREGLAAHAVAPLAVDQDLRLELLGRRLGLGFRSFRDGRHASYSLEVEQTCPPVPNRGGTAPVQPLILMKWPQGHKRRFSGRRPHHLSIGPDGTGTLGSKWPGSGDDRARRRGSSATVSSKRRTLAQVDQAVVELLRRADRVVVPLDQLAELEAGVAARPGASTRPWKWRDHQVDPLVERRLGAGVAVLGPVGELAEEERVGQGPAADRDRRAAGLAEHRRGVGQGADVAVADDRDPTRRPRPPRGCPRG